MANDNLPALSKETERLLRAEGNHWLAEDEIQDFNEHVLMICGLVDRLPAVAEFSLINWDKFPVVVVPRVEGFTREQLGIAAYLLPLHRQLCFLSLDVLWKADQMVRALCEALNARAMLVAAGMARSMMETSAAFGCETNRVNDVWRERKKKPAPTMESLAEFCSSINSIVGQRLFGTKLKRGDEVETGIERTNVLTFIKKAGQLSETAWAERIYHLLCDAVHPSVGANRALWISESFDADSGIAAIQASRYSKGLLGDLPFAVAEGALWAMKWLTQMWILFERTRNDLCLTANTFALGDDYYGNLRAPERGQPCQCKCPPPCRHAFGAC